MKKRLLALCLAAALLLGILPALTLSTEAAEWETTSTSTFYDLVDSTSSYKGYCNWSSTMHANYYGFTAGTTGRYWHITQSDYSAISFDHTQEMILTLSVNINKAQSYYGIQGELVVDSTGNPTGTNCAVMSLMDYETQSFIYFGLTGIADASTIQAVIMLPEMDETTQKYKNVYIPLNKVATAAATSGVFGLGIHWHTDGDVTILVDGVEKATVADATWTVDTEKTAGTAWNPAAYKADGTTTNACDFITFLNQTWNQWYLYDYSAAYTTIQHGRYITPELDAYFTTDGITVDGAVTETAWEYADFQSVGGLETAVLVNNGAAYVGVKGDDGTYDVKLGDFSGSVVVSDGDGEIAIDSYTVSSYGVETTLTVNGEEADLTFAAKAVDTAMQSVDLYTNTTTINQMYNTSVPVYVQTSNNLNVLSKDNRDGDLDIDRSENVSINLSLQIQKGFLIDSETLYGTSANGVKNNLCFYFSDEETNTYIQVWVTQDSNGYVCLGVLDSSSISHLIQLTNEYAQWSDSANEDLRANLKELYVVWNTDDSVSVVFDGETVETVPSATISGDAGGYYTAALSPDGASGTKYPSCDVFKLFVQSQGSSKAYIYDLSVSTARVGVKDIETHSNDSYSLDLGSDIGFNFNIAENPGATITVTAGDETTTYKADNLTATNGKYLIEANVAAAQMTETVRVTIKDAYGIVSFDKITSVRNYTEKLLADETTTEAAKTLVNAMLVYGGAAQTYFKYNTTDMVSSTAPSDALLSDTTASEAAWDNGLTGIAARSAALVAEDKVVIRYYFTADSVDGYTFKNGETVLTPAYSTAKGAYYVDIEVLPQNMATMYTVIVSADGVETTTTVSYSCLTYMKNHEADADENLVKLMKAMYDYYAAAAAYVG